MSGLASFEKKVNPLAKYDPLSASNLFKKKTPTPPPAVPPPIIPITETGRDTLMASKDAAAALKKRKGLLSTIRAGETNSGTSYSSNFGTRSLLGAGP